MLKKKGGSNIMKNTMHKLSRIFHAVRLVLSGVIIGLLVKSASVLSELKKYEILKISLTAEELGVMDFMDVAGSLYLWAVFFYFSVALAVGFIVIYFFGIPKYILPDWIKWILRDFNYIREVTKKESIEEETYNIGPGPTKEQMDEIDEVLSSNGNNRGNE
jgi:hypothetical protein